MREAFLQYLGNGCGVIDNGPRRTIGEIDVLNTASIGHLVEPHTPLRTANEEIRAKERCADCSGDNLSEISHHWNVTLEELNRLFKARIVAAMHVDNLPSICFT